MAAAAGVAVVIMGLVGCVAGVLWLGFNAPSRFLENPSIEEVSSKGTSAFQVPPAGLRVGLRPQGGPGSGSPGTPFAEEGESAGLPGASGAAYKCSAHLCFMRSSMLIGAHAGSCCIFHLALGRGGCMKSLGEYV